MQPPANVANVTQRIAAIQRLVTPVDAAAFQARVDEAMAATPDEDATSGGLATRPQATSRTAHGLRLGPVGNRAPSITLGQLMAAYGATPAAGPVTGGTASDTGPLLVPVDGELSSEFGMRTHPVHGDHRMHTGVDVAAPTGTPIRAAAGGEVVFAGDRGGYGLTIEIDHGNGRTTRYAHQSALDVEVGQRVERGQVIGRVGSTGVSTGPHLHFEVRVDGEPIDPRLHLAGVR